MTTRNRVRELTASTVLVMLILSLTSCGRDEPAVCAQADQVQQSMRQLQNTNISENGLSSLTSTLTQMRAQLSQLSSEAKDQFSPQIEGVKSAMNQLQGAASAAIADPSAENFGPVRTALNDLRTQMDALETAVKGTCGG